MNVLEDDIIEHLESLGPAAHLVAVCDMAELDEASRDVVRERFAGRMTPLLQDPALHALHPYSPLLLSAEPADSDRYYKLAHTFQNRLRYAVHGWITSTLPPARLAEHLAKAMIARGPDGDAYLLRHYDPRVLRVLYNKAPQNWWREFIAPIGSWWIPQGDSETLRWARIPGSGGAPFNPPSPLVVDPPLWEALAGDPFPHRVLQRVETHAPGLLDNPCRGVRLARIQILLSGAREAGLSTHEDLFDYVLLSLAHGTTSLAADRRWQLAVRSAVAGDGRLGDLYHSHCRQQA